MKLQLEKSEGTKKGSFRLLHDPKLSDLFFWHFHPEVELVYIEAANGVRHVGEHLSNFETSDLVLIGSYIPHLNFDYGIKVPYLKEVLHLDVDFCHGLLPQLPELPNMSGLLERSQYGMAFYGQTKKIVGQHMKRMYGQPSFEQLLVLFKIMNLLGESDEFEQLHQRPVLVEKLKNKQQRLKRVYAHIGENYHRKIPLGEAAALVNLGEEAFCRYFKNASGSTFTLFLNQYRVTQAKRLLLSGKNIGETCNESGFESLSYFNRVFKKITGENPSVFKKRIRGG